MRYLKTKDYFYSAMLSILWLFFLIYPFIMGLIFCSHGMQPCYSSERFVGSPFLNYWFGKDYAPTEWVISALDKLTQIHRYFDINKLGLPLIVVASFAFGFATYWLLTETTKHVQKRSTGK